MKVTAKERSQGSTNSITITNDGNRLTKAEIERMIADAERYRRDDLEQQKRALTRNKLDYCCQDAISSVQNVTHSSKKDLVEKCERALNNSSSASNDQMLAQMDEINRLLSSMGINLNQK